MVTYDEELALFRDAFTEIEYFINREYTDSSISSQYDSSASTYSSCSSQTVVVSSSTTTTSTCDDLKWISYLRDKPASMEAAKNYVGYYYES